MQRLRFVFLPLVVPAVALVAGGFDIGVQAQQPAWREIAVSSAPALDLPVPEQVVLNNATTLLLLPDATLDRVEVLFHITVGALQDPPDRTGLMAITAEAALAGGSRKRPGEAFRQVLNLHGARIQLGCDSDNVLAQLLCLRQSLPELLGLLVELLKEPAFTEDVIDAAIMRERVRISRRNEFTTGILRRELPRALYGAYSGTEHAPTRLSSYSSIDRIDRQAIVEVHRRYYHPGNFIIGVTGNFERDEVVRQLNEHFANWPVEGKTSAPEFDTRLRQKDANFLIERNDSAAYFGFGQLVTTTKKDERFVGIHLLNEVLFGTHGRISALSQSRSRTNLNGNILLHHDRPGLLTIYGRTAYTDLEKALEGINELLQQVRERGVTTDELNAARAALRTDFLFRVDTREKLMRRILTYRQHGLPLDFDRNYYRQLEQFDLESMRKLCRELLDPKKSITLLAGNGEQLRGSHKRGSKLESLDISIPTPVKSPMLLDPAKTLQGQKLLAEALEAAGGLEVFKNLHTFRADLLMYVGPMRLSAVMRIQPPNAVRADVATPVGAVTQIVTDRGAWQARGSSIKEIEAAEARNNLIGLAQTELGIMRVIAQGKKGYNVQALEPIRLDNEMLDGVVIESEVFGRVKLYFDSTTKWMRKMIYIPGGQQQEAVKIFSNHRRFGPLTLAGRTEDSDPKARAKIIEMVAAQINPVLEPELFSKPDKATPPPPLKQ